MTVAVLAVLLTLLVGGAFVALAMGRLHLDLGWGRSLHRLGPLHVDVDAPRDLVYEVLSAPYLGRARNDAISRPDRNTLSACSSVTRSPWRRAASACRSSGRS